MLYAQATCEWANVLENDPSFNGPYVKGTSNVVGTVVTAGKTPLEPSSCDHRKGGGGERMGGTLVQLSRQDAMAMESELTNFFGVGWRDMSWPTFGVNEAHSVEPIKERMVDQTPNNKNIGKLEEVIEVKGEEHMIRQIHGERHDPSNLTIAELRAQIRYFLGEVSQPLEGGQPPAEGIDSTDYSGKRAGDIIGFGWDGAQPGKECRETIACQHKMRKWLEEMARRYLGRGNQSRAGTPDDDEYYDGISESMIKSFQSVHLARCLSMDNERESLRRGANAHALGREKRNFYKWAGSKGPMFNSITVAKIEPLRGYE